MTIQSFTGETSVLADTVLYTPPADGLYRMSIYATTSDTNNQHGLYVRLSFTDPYGQKSDKAVLALDGNNVAALSFPIFCKANTTISISTSPSGTIPSPYDLYVALEELSTPATT